MALTLNVGSGQSKRAKIVVVTGEPGVGKTGMCLTAESPFFVTFDPGNDWHNGKMFKTEQGTALIPHTVDDAFEMLAWCTKKANIEENEIKTVVVDSLSQFQNLVYADIVLKHPVYTEHKEQKPTKSITDLGYDGRGYAMDYFNRIIAFGERMKERGVNVIFITHSEKVKAVTDSNNDVKVWDIGLQIYGQHNVAALFKKQADFVYHLYAERTGTTKGAGMFQKTSAEGQSTSQVIVQTRETSLRYAKTRAIDESSIPDFYMMDSTNRAEIRAEIFKQIKEN